MAIRHLPRWLAAGALALSAISAMHAARAEDSAQRGARIYRLAGCENCHTDRANGGARLAGGRILATPLGTFLTPNITPDSKTGIGNWQEDDFRDALRFGRSPRGENYYPSFPYTSYTRLSDSDIHDLWTYMRSIPAVEQANKNHELPWYLRFRVVLGLWKWLFFEPGAYRDDPKQSAEWNRGAYLAQGAGHCSECHTPRNMFGGFKGSLMLAGTMHGPEGIVVPNITPDTRFGIGKWSASDIGEYLTTGNRFDGNSAGNLMAEVIDNGLKYLPRADIEAIATYLRALPANANPIVKAKSKPRSNAREAY